MAVLVRNVLGHQIQNIGERVSEDLWNGTIFSRKDFIYGFCTFYNTLQAGGNHVKYAVERVMHECIQILLENVEVVSGKGEYDLDLKF